MKEFEYKTRGKGSPYGKQHVYFTCHPDDFDLYFDEISQIVLKKYDCTIWYNQDDVDDKQEYALKLNEIRLLIIPITKNFLTKQCRARCVDLPFALEHHIPVLPLMQTPGLDEAFAKICGDLHYIDKNACDVTTLTYEQKINKFLSMSLISNEMTQKIKEAFYARIFLSYRKKDRVLADKLMRLIHDIPFCRDAAIWFDEYLVPGQSFNGAIAEAMRSSRLFVLCVTENLIEKGNYVQTIEYPKARELSLPIMPVAPGKITPEQISLLKKQYDDIPECVNGNDSEQLANRFHINFTDIAVNAETEDPKHLFFIGLAYLNGIDVEIDNSRATALITQAADLGYWPAMEKLVTMYKIGEGVARNLNKALEMYENLIQAISESGDDKKLLEVHCDLLRMLFDSNLQHENTECVMSHTMSVVDLALKIELSNAELFKMFSLLAFVNEHDEEVADIFINSALEHLPAAYEDEDEVLAEEAFFYSRLAALFYRRSAGLIVYIASKDPAHGQRRKQSIQYITKAIDLLQRLYEKDPIRWKVNYTDALNIFCTMNYSQPFCDDQELMDAMERAIALYRELCEDNAALYAAKLAELCFHSGDHLAYDIDIVWEKEFDFYIDLSSENYVPGMPEQQIPLNPTLGEASDACDFRRARKALSLMRYSVALYEEYMTMEQEEDLWVSLSLAQAYFGLSRLLYCFSQWIKDIQENGIEEIGLRLLRDSYDGYRKMLAVMRKCAWIMSARRPGFEYKKSTNFNSQKQLSEKELVELEEEAYGEDPLAECYNFAVALSDEGLEQEAMQLHEELYHFFKEVYKNANPILVLANLYAYACGKKDVDEMLSILLEFDDSWETHSSRNVLTKGDILYDYYCKIAQCYMKKDNPVAADEWFTKARKERSYFAPYQHAQFNKLWASSKKDMGDLTGAEKLVWEGLECLIQMESIPAELWNSLSREYASLLIQMGRKQEADSWLNGMLMD